MNNEINDNCKTFKNKNNCQIKYSDSFNTIKRNNHKKHEELNDVQDNYSNLYVKIPAKRCSKKIAKSKNYLGNSLRRKKTAFERKEKEEKEAKEIKGESDFHKIKTFNPKNKNKINSQEEYFSPQYKKRPNIGLNKNDNDNDNDILKLVSLTNKIYENEEHFQKKIINKKLSKNISPNPRVKMRNILSGKINDLSSQKNKLNYGLNYKLCKDLLPENTNKNFRRRFSSNVKPGDFNLFTRSKETSNYSNLLKIKQNIKNLTKERKNSKFFFETQKNNNRYKLNNDNQNQLSRAKTFKQSRKKDNKYYETINEKAERTTIKSIKRIKLNKMNSQKNNANKIDFNKSQIQNEEFNPIESIKNKNKFKKYRKSWCFLCCLKEDSVDSDNEN
jgi:hypothetical protein